jgi:hypothetical protein
MAKTTRRTSGTFNFANTVVFDDSSTTITSNNLITTDPVITVNSSQGSIPSNGSGIEIEESSVVVASILYTQSNGDGTWSFVGTGASTIDFGNANVSIGGNTSYANLEVTDTVTAANVDINGGYIDNVHLGHDVAVHVHASDVLIDGNLTINGTIATGAVGNLANGHLQGNLWGDLKTDDGSNIILYNGSDNTGSDATIKASVLSYNGTVVLNNGTNGTDATFLGNTTGTHFGNIVHLGTVVLDSTTGALTGTVSSLSNHTTDNLAEGSANLYYTDTRVDNVIANTSVNSLSDVAIVDNPANDGGYLRFNYSNSGSTVDVAFLGQAVANFKTDQNTSTTAVSGTTLQNESASGLSVSITPQSTANKIEIQTQVRYTVQTSSGDTEFYIRLYRDKGANTEVLLSEDVVVGNTTETFHQTHFSTFDAPGDTSPHTYSVYYDANTANGTLTPNPTYSTGTSTSHNCMHLTEIIDQANILTEISQDTSPQISSSASNLDLNNKKIINLATPTLGTDAATKTYVDNAVATANELSELTDVNTTGATANSILKYNGSAWVVSTDVDTTDISSNTITQLSDVDTSGATTNSILKYNGNTWVVGTDIDTDTGILNVVEDTSPQLGGNLDLNSQSITGTGTVNIVGSFAGTNANLSGNLTASGGEITDLTISGNLTVLGDTTTVDVTQLEVDDPLLYLNRNAGDSSTNSLDAGLLVERGSTEDHAGMIWQESSDQFVFFTSNAVTSTTTVVSNIALANIQANVATLTATQAQYADLAELYESDAEYEPGTVVIFGGDKEVTQSNTAMDHRIAGVVSTDPAYLMNSTQTGTTVAVALRGRVPVNVVGPVKKGDLIVSSEIPGVGKAFDGVTNCVFVIGKAIEDDDSENLVRLITCVI